MCSAVALLSPATGGVPGLYLPDAHHARTVTGFFILTLLWGGLLWYIAVTPTEKMQMTWLVLIGLILLAPLLALIWPALR